MAQTFDHEKLQVYRDSLAFVAWLESILQKVPKATAARIQLSRASTSIVLNLAEGNGKFTGSDRCRFFDIARGSALECAGGVGCARREDSVCYRGGRGRKGEAQTHCFDDCRAYQSELLLSIA